MEGLILFTCKKVFRKIALLVGSIREKDYVDSIFGLYSWKNERIK